MAGKRVIEVENVSKSFKLYAAKPTSLKERVIGLGRTPYEEFHALTDISLHLEEGETLGLVGHNGSGKSTLLKCITGTLRPTSGTIRTRGRVVALLELGAGFHPDLTGRENVYLNGSILGLSTREIDNVFDDIVEFSELAPFIDNQVKHYSSGMYARLGFAVAVNVDPDILLVDEVLSVGDEAFQRKCLDRIKLFQREGRSIMLVSHAADLVRQICDRAAVLDQGQMITIGDTSSAVRTYRETLAARGIELAAANFRELTHDIRISHVKMDKPDPGRDWLKPGEPLTIRVGYETTEAVEEPVFAMEIHDREGNRLLGVNTEILGLDLGTLAGSGEVSFNFGYVPLLDGVFAVSIGIHSVGSLVEYDHRDQLDHFSVASQSETQGIVDFNLTASHKPA
ncbi:MAG: ABC transporter ATP-binding protein [Acidimicrobiia bacterium]